MFAFSKAVLLGIAALLFQSAATLDICKTKGCQAFSERMLSCMDRSARPCDDFYRFSCGTFQNNAEIPEEQMQNSSFIQVKQRVEEHLKSILFEKSNPADPLIYRNLRHIFSLCMDEKTINERGVGHAVARLRQAGGWPVLGDWDEKNWNFLDTEINLSNLSLDGGSLFVVRISLDFKNTSRRVLQVDQATLGLPRDFLVKGMDDPVVKAYYSYMVDMAVMYGAERKTASEQLRESLLFEIELAKLTVPKEERRDYDRTYNPFTLKNLKTEISWVNWDKLLKSIMPADVPPQENELIIVSEVDFLKKLEGFLLKYPKKVIANHMMWHAAKGLEDMLTDAMRNRSQGYKRALIGTTARLPRWKECLGAAESLQIALSSLYVKKFFDQTSKKEAFDMVERVRQEMYKVIQEVDWMDNVTRSRALEKVLKVRDNIAYPDELLDISKIERYYEGLVLDGEQYFEELLKLSQWQTNYEFRRLREPVNKTDWRDNSKVVMVNAYYSPQQNSIIFPAGILQQPFFDAQLPKYVNYAAVGFFMSHEITHGFDDEGSQFDYNGDLKAWWTDDSMKIFVEKKKCLINQYSNFVDTLTGLHLNGINTQGENVADNGAIKLAFRAYKKLNLEEPLLPGLQNYTQDQLFILSMATLWCSRTRAQTLKYLITTDPHSPDEFRVNGVLKNFPEFSEIFGCSKNDTMNPKDKCVVW